MPKKLSEDQVHAYHRDGFLSPIDVMTEVEALDLRRRFEEAEAQYPDDLNPFNRNNPHLAFSFIDEIAHHPALLDAVEDIIGPDIVLCGTVLFIKEPDNPGYVSWHQDATYVGLEPNDGVTAWLALTPATPETGCMQMLPGTHTGGIRTHHDTFGENNILTRGQSIDVGDASGAVDVVLQPGQMSLHHPRVIHASQPNAGTDRRIGVVMQQFLPHHVQVTKGEPLVQWARGAPVPDHYREMPRPKFDMDPAGVAWRQRHNDIWADVLYENAEKKRAY